MSREYTEILNLRIPAGSRTLYIDLKKNKDGSKFVSISEVRHSEPAERSRILVDEQYVADLHRGLAAVLELVDDGTRTKSLRAAGKRRGPVRAYEVWTAHEEQRLVDEYVQGCGVTELATRFGRAPTAIISRLCQLGKLKTGERPRWD